MIKSMTGFGLAASNEPALGEISVEVRSVNNRFLDFSVRLPRELNSLEPRIREDVKKRLRRGKVEMYIRYVPAPEAQALYDINPAALRHYATQIQAAFADVPDQKTDLNALLQLPGVIAPAPAAAEDGPLTRLVADVVDASLRTLEQAREVEGQALIAAIAEHLSVLAEIRHEVEQAKGELLDDYKKRLAERVETLSRSADVTIDPARLDTEILFFADKCDITEELVRLDAHIKAFRALLQRDTGEPVGKSMDFLVQELLRETNTIGNKARGVAVASRIVAMKTEIEKIREQVQNLE